MHTCSHCAEHAVIGGETASVCVNCGALATDTVSLGVVAVYVAGAVGAAYLAFRAGTLLASKLSPEVV